MRSFGLKICQRDSGRESNRDDGVKAVPVHCCDLMTGAAVGCGKVSLRRQQASGPFAFAAVFSFARPKDPPLPAIGHQAAVVMYTQFPAKALPMAGDRLRRDVQVSARSEEH